MIFFKRVCLLIGLLIVIQPGFCGNDKTTVTLSNANLAEKGYEHSNSIVIIEEPLVLHRPLRLLNSDLQGKFEADAVTNERILQYQYKEFESRDYTLSAGANEAIRTTLSGIASQTPYGFPIICASQAFEAESLLIFSGNITITNLVFPAPVKPSTISPFSIGDRSTDFSISFISTFLTTTASVNKIPNNLEIKTMTEESAEKLSNPVEALCLNETEQEQQNTGRSQTPFTQPDIKEVPQQQLKSAARTTLRPLNASTEKAAASTYFALPAEKHPSLHKNPLKSGKKTFDQAIAEAKNSWGRSQRQQSDTRFPASSHTNKISHNSDKTSHGSSYPFNTDVSPELLAALADGSLHAQRSSPSSKEQLQQTGFTHNSPRNTSAAESIQKLQSMEGDKLIDDLKQPDRIEQDSNVNSVISWGLARKKSIRDHENAYPKNRPSTKVLVWEEKIKAAKEEVAKAADLRKHFEKTRGTAPTPDLITLPITTKEKQPKGDDTEELVSGSSESSSESSSENKG